MALKPQLRIDFPEEMLDFFRVLKGAAADAAGALKQAVWVDGVRTGFVAAAILFLLVWLVLLVARRR